MIAIPGYGAWMHTAALQRAAQVSANKDLMHSDPEPLNAKQHNRYRSAVGSMQYYVTMTQWHLAHPVARLAQKNQSLTAGDMKQLEQTLAWIAQNTHRQISAPVLKHTPFKVLQIY